MSFTTRVENKATRLIDGTDFDALVDRVVPMEKIYYNSLQYITPLNPAMPLVGQKASVVLLIPSLDGSSFYGGTATALIVAAKMAAALGRPLRIVQTLKTGKPTGIVTFLQSAGVKINASNVHVSSVADRRYNFYGYLPTHKDDVYVASAWWDAYLINQLPLTKKFVYLVQDFEPVFYNNSDLYVLAESTYQMDSFVPLCNTKLIYDFMRQRNYPPFSKKSAAYFEPAVSCASSGLRQKKSPGEKKRLFLYGRPNVHRNLFLTALSAINQSFEAGFLDKDEWELFMAGQDKLPDIKLSSGPVIHNKGKMALADYVAFSKTVDVAVSPMMAPHPNYPTLEFASIGSMVVTTKYANKVDLSNYSKNIILTDVFSESIAEGIRLAATQIKASAAKDIKPARGILDDWDSALDEPLRKVLQSLDK
ncbi:hypothetical protein CSA80_03570 [Candidatus Saccharibacteria bacterium]|nr:MAG: hypothetical protein CR973_01065 [Candidatus Saccharibacteria bacterium]PID99167.1 MAG: hypothetical protein CSA80_03570 [Candidatus Saccharibacteria bacterium]